MILAAFSECNNLKQKNDFFLKSSSMVFEITQFFEQPKTNTKTLLNIAGLNFLILSQAKFTVQ